MKKLFTGILFNIMMFVSVLTVSAATTHEHNYEGHYSYEKVYSYDTPCNIHDDCKIRKEYYNVFDSCTSCGFRTLVKTEEKELHVITIIDRPFR